MADAEQRTSRVCDSTHCCYAAARAHNSTPVADHDRCRSTARCHWQPATRLAKRSLSRKIGECKFGARNLTASVAWNLGRGIPFGSCGGRTVSAAEWRVCWPPVERSVERGACLVYSFGIAQADPLAWLMASAGCRVHAFDPGAPPPRGALPPNVTFHRWGLPTDPSLSERQERLFTSASYGATSEGEYLSMRQIRARLGHERTPLTVLKLDCEGCEWWTLATIELGLVEQLLAELHFSSSLRFSERVAGDVVPSADANLRAHGFAAFHYRAQPGSLPDQHVPPALVAAGMRHASCCREVSLVKSASLNLKVTPVEHVERQGSSVGSHTRPGRVTAYKIGFALCVSASVSLHSGSALWLPTSELWLPTSELWLPTKGEASLV
eukprot:7380051-Prymnesium_polylepis.2